MERGEELLKGREGGGGTEAGERRREIMEREWEAGKNGEREKENKEEASKDGRSGEGRE